MKGILAVVAVAVVAVVPLLTSASLTAQRKSPAYKVGEEGVTMPVVVKEVKPRYPLAALNAGKSAVVTLECVVTPEGRPTHVRVLKRATRDFEREAIKALRQWHFEPGRKDGRPVPVRVEVDLTFTAK